MAINKLQCGIGRKSYEPTRPDPDKTAHMSRVQQGRVKRSAVARTVSVAKAKAAIRRTNLIDVDIPALMQEFNLTEGKVRTLIAKIRQERERGLRPHANASAQ